MQQPRVNERMIELMYLIGAICAGVLMISLFVAAFWEIGGAVFVFFRILPSRNPKFASDSDALVVALKGIEYLFLAPMSFLVYRNLAIYVAAQVTGSENSQAEVAVTETKGLVTSLMIAVVATDLVGKALSPEGLAERPPVYELTLMVVLGAYFFLLHWVAGSRSHFSPTKR